MKNQVCARCFLDNTVEDIVFDSVGNCNYCTDFEKKNNHFVPYDLVSLIGEIKKYGKGKKYDCIVGVSGGVDSSYVLVMAVQMGLRPLVVHFDNGWNSIESQKNINNLISKLGVDLYTHVVEWGDFCSGMQAFFDADVVDVELLTDNALIATLWDASKKFGVKYILNGHNRYTEGIKMPKGWNWFKLDKANINDILRANGIKRHKIPLIGLFDLFVYQVIYRKRMIQFLDYVKFDNNEVLELLKTNYNYNPYPHKHYESVFTRFYQAYILPKKFKIDKRKVHYSSLLMTGQAQKDECQRILLKDPFESAEIERDKLFFLKKMSWTTDQLDSYINRRGRSHLYYKSEFKYFKLALKIRNFVK